MVVHVIFRLDVGGLENGVVNLINHMPREQYRHAIVCLAGFTDFRRRIRGDDVAVYSLDKKPGKDFGAYVRFWRLLRQLRPAIVHTRNLGTIDMQWVALAAGVKRRIHSEHGWEASDPTGANVKNLRIRKVCAVVIQRFAAVSQDLASWLKAQVGIAAERVVQIYNGVDTDRFASQGSPPDDLPWRNASGEARPFVFGIVGRLDPIKNHVGLLEAFAALVQSAGTNAERMRLVIVGDGPMSGAVQAKVAALGLQRCVWMAGVRNDVAALMRSFDVFVLPSLNEGISNTILEAMAAGKPVIAAKVGGNHELIEHNSTGQLYSHEQAAGLESAMRLYWQSPDLARLHGDAGRKRVLSQFSLNAMVRGYVDLYNKLITV